MVSEEEEGKAVIEGMWKLAYHPEYTHSPHTSDTCPLNL